MSIIIPANSAVGGGFDVANSAMFNSATSDYMYNAFSNQPTNSRKGTFSFWFKMSQLSSSADKYLFSTYDNSNNFTQLKINTDKKLEFQTKDGGSTSLRFDTNQLFLDTAAWYNLVIAIDTTLGTAGDRVKIYLNGTRITSFATETTPSQNLVPQILYGGITKWIGVYGNGNASRFDGYMSEVLSCDGTQNDVTDFGEFDSDSGIWVPKDVSGLTFGTNGYYLNFSTASALGTDVSGQSENWTTNGLGTQNQYTDTPSNTYTTFAGYVGVQGGASAAQIFVEGATRDGGGVGGPLSTTLFPSKGKWFIEYNVEQADSQSDAGFGFWSLATSQYYNFYGSGFKGYVIKYNGATFLNGSSSTSVGSFGNGSIISFAMDFDNDVINIYKDGNLHVQNYSYPISDYTDLGTGVIDGANSSSVDLNYDLNSGSGNGTFNGRKTAGGNADGNGYGNFSMAVPSGYYAINTKNIAEFG